MRARWLVALAVLWPGLAWAQGATGVNPPVGALWTYLGATYGAGWVKPGGFVPPISMTDDRTAEIPAQSRCILGAYTRPTPTPQQIANWVFTGPGQNLPVNYDAVCGVGILNPNAGVPTIPLVNGITGYAVSDAPAATQDGGYPMAVAQMGFSIAGIDNARTWGNNVNLTDTKGQAVSAGVGRDLTAYEGDINFTSPNTTGIGLVLQGASLSQPAFAIGVLCGPLDLYGYQAGTAVISRWNQCFSTLDYSTTVALSIGKAGTSAASNQSSQLAVMGYSNAAGASHNVSFYAAPGGVQGGGLDFNNTENTLVNLNGAAYISPDSPNLPQAAFTTGVDTSAGGMVSRPSRSSIFQYTDAASARQAVFMKAGGGAAGVLQVTSTGPSTSVTTGTFWALDGFQIGGLVGVTCAGAPGASFRVTKGIITTC